MVISRRQHASCASGRVLLALIFCHGTLAMCQAQQPSHEPSVTVTAEGEGSGGRIVAQIKIKAPADAVWRTMLDCAVSLRIVSGLQTCRIIERDPAGQWDVREHVVAWAVLLPSVRSVFRSEYQPHNIIQFSRVSGDLKKLEGRWQLMPNDGGRSTQLKYNAVVDLGLPLPGALVRSAIESDVIRVLKALQAEAEARYGK